MAKTQEEINRRKFIIALSGGICPEGNPHWPTDDIREKDKERKEREASDESNV